MQKNVKALFSESRSSQVHGLHLQKQRHFCRPRILPLYLLFLSIAFTGCDKISLPGQNKNKEVAEAAIQSKDFPKAIRLYESALDGTSKTADVHYRLGIIYDSYLDDPISALHHYRRFLRMSKENDPHSSEVRQSITRLERLLASKLSQSGLVSKSDAIRLRNENLELRKQLAQFQKNTPQSSSASHNTQSTPAPATAKGFSTVPQTAEAEQLIGKETRTYTVQAGDTLASISRKFYKTSGRWKDIADANHNQLNGKTNIRQGQVLIIP